jgi:hypothetical protein
MAEVKVLILDLQPIDMPGLFLEIYPRWRRSVIEPKSWEPQAEHEMVNRLEGGFLRIKVQRRLTPPSDRGGGKTKRGR